MTADPTPAPERYEYALLDLIHVSKSNPRKHVDETALRELAGSIKDHGIIEPIIVQDRGTKGYEIVAGERRFLAARIAGLVEVPVIVRPFSAEEMPLVRLIENLQRQDLNAIDLAHGYHTLIKDFKYTADQVADLVKKSRRHVYATMQLLTLSGDSRKALEKGELSASVASLLARVPEKRQPEAFQKLRGYNTLIPDATGLSVRHAEEVLRNFIGQPLAGVPWKLDDAELLPEQGPCSTCQFNARNIPDLVDVYPDADVCTSIEGFKAKQVAQHRRDQARYADKGNVKVLTAAESKKLSKYGYFSPHQSGYVALTDPATHGDDSKTYGQILKGKDDVTVYVGRGPKGGEVKLVKLADVTPHLKAAGVAVSESRVPVKQTPEDKAKREHEHAVDDRARAIVVKRVHERMPKVKQVPAFIPLLIRGGARLDEVSDAVLELRGVKERRYDQVTKWIDKLKPQDILPVWLESEVDNPYHPETEGDQLDAILKLCGLPSLTQMLKDARKQADTELKAEAKIVKVVEPVHTRSKKKSAKAKKVAK